MTLCRWQSEESVAGYAQHSAQAYTRLLDDAYARDFTQVRYSKTPVSQEYEMIRNMSDRACGIYTIQTGSQSQC